MKAIKDREKFMNELKNNLQRVVGGVYYRYKTDGIECLTVTDIYKDSSLELKLYDAGLEVRTNGAFAGCLCFSVYGNKTQLFMGVTRMLTNAGF